MSNHIVWVADADATQDEAPLLAERGFTWLVEERIIEPVSARERSACGAKMYRPGPKASAWSIQVRDNLIHCGIEITVGRTVFYSCPGPISVRCRHCGTSHGGEVPWTDAVSAWYANEGDDKLRCPTCCRAERIVDWTFLELDWAFGHLGFGFHNWSINDDLAQALGKVLRHRMKIAHEHI